MFCCISVSDFFLYAWSWIWVKQASLPRNKSRKTYTGERGHLDSNFKLEWEIVIKAISQKNINAILTVIYHRKLLGINRNNSFIIELSQKMSHNHDSNFKQMSFYDAK